MITAINKVKKYMLSQLPEQDWRTAFENDYINDNIYMNGPQTDEEIELVFEQMEQYVDDAKYEFVGNAGEPTGKYHEDWFCIQQRAMEMYDGTFVCWENEMGGGKHVEPNEAWMFSIKYIKATKEMKLVNVYEDV